MTRRINLEEVPDSRLREVLDSLLDLLDIQVLEHPDRRDQFTYTVERRPKDY